jgi:ATP-dependent DNA ligase
MAKSSRRTNTASADSTPYSQPQAETRHFYAFDLIWLNGADLRNRPLVKRKERLCELVRGTGCTANMCATH